MYTVGPAPWTDATAGEEQTKPPVLYRHASLPLRAANE
jgi:hypothetical protein